MLVIIEVIRVVLPLSVLNVLSPVRLTHRMNPHQLRALVAVNIVEIIGSGIVNVVIPFIILVIWLLDNSILNVILRIHHAIFTFVGKSLVLVLRKV